jgi:hypothetical protein
LRNKVCSSRNLIRGVRSIFLSVVQLYHVQMVLFIQNFLLVINSSLRNTFRKRMSKVEKAMYSLNPFGCKQDLLSLQKSIAFINKQYCQSIIKFELERLHINEAMLNQLNASQNILLKNALGINYYAQSRPILNTIKVEKLK